VLLRQERRSLSGRLTPNPGSGPAIPSHTTGATAMYIIQPDHKTDLHIANMANVSRRHCKVVRVRAKETWRLPPLSGSARPVLPARQCKEYCAELEEWLATRTRSGWFVCDD
jgi:hypothetical protein